MRTKVSGVNLRNLEKIQDEWLLFQRFVTSIVLRVNIGFPVVRTDGRSAYGHVITKFSGMGRFTKLCGSAHARVELRYYQSNKKRGKKCHILQSE